MTLIKFISTCLLSVMSLIAFSQTPVNDDCANAIVINDARNYCSANGQYTNINATPSFTGTGNDVWFRFTARNFEVKITVTGADGGGTLRSPQIRMYNDCNGSGRVAPSVVEGNMTIFNNAGLIPGRTYYFTVSGSNTGSFKLCVENYQSEIQPGQDFSSASLLCTSQSIVKQVNLTGSGARNDEVAGTCIGEEKQSAWYQWTAANSGSLVFTLTPNKFDDIDWALFELGPEGNTSSPSAANVIRCAAGHGIDNSTCRNEPLYTKTGLDFNESDITEQGGCGKGQNGKLKFVDMKQGYVYALLVNNFTEGNNGFELAFTDQSGKAGTGLFKGPTAKMSSTNSNLCSPQQSFTFSASISGASAINWYFGEGASIEEANTAGPFTITYRTPGLKTVVLQVKNELGCSVVETQTFLVGITPDVPRLTVNKTDFCIADTIRLSTQAQTDVTYRWTGPNNFTSDLQSPEIPVTSGAAAGTYTLIVSRGDCVASASSIVVPPVYNQPVAAFTADPKIPNKLAYPVRVRFLNESKDADAYLWDFGDGTTSTDKDPEHTYSGSGSFDVTLTVFKSNVCQASVVKGSYLISPAGAVFVPNTFTPNNDGVNDEFVVNMNNIRTYQIQIYNRFGVIMYRSEDIVQNWNGMYQNEPVPVGTYYYLIDAVDLDNNVIRKSGYVTILR